MLCTRMRLVERRFPNENGTNINNINNNNVRTNGSNTSGITNRIGSSLINTEGISPTPTSSMGVIQRPCIIRNLEGLMNGDLNLTRNIYDHSKKGSDKEKPPLVIVSLDLPPGIKTLAPHDLKRDPKRIPCFSDQLKEFKRTQSHYDGPKKTMIQNQNDNNNNDDATLMIRGFDILNTGKTDSENSNSDLNDNQNHDDDDDNDDLYGSIYFWNKPMVHESGDLIPRELQIQLTDCCQCMHDVNSMRRDFKFGQLFSENSDDIPEDLLPILKQHEEQQQQQHHQHQKIQQQQQQQQLNNNMQDSRYLTINNSGRIEPYQAYKPPYVPYTRMLFRRTPSPRTRQVINVNVTMNTKK